MDIVTAEVSSTESFGEVPSLVPREVLLSLPRDFAPCCSGARQASPDPVTVLIGGTTPERNGAGEVLQLGSKREGLSPPSLLARSHRSGFEVDGLDPPDPPCQPEGLLSLSAGEPCCRGGAPNLLRPANPRWARNAAACFGSAFGDDEGRIFVDGRAGTPFRHVRLRREECARIFSASALASVRRKMPVEEGLRVFGTFSADTRGRPPMPLCPLANADGISKATAPPPCPLANAETPRSSEEGNAPSLLLSLVRRGPSPRRPPSSASSICAVICSAIASWGAAPPSPSVTMSSEDAGEDPAAPGEDPARPEPAPPPPPPRPISYVVRITV